MRIVAERLEIVFGVHRFQHFARGDGKYAQGFLFVVIGENEAVLNDGLAVLPQRAPGFLPRGVDAYEVARAVVSDHDCDLAVRADEVVGAWARRPVDVSVGTNDRRRAACVAEERGIVPESRLVVVTALLCDLRGSRSAQAVERPIAHDVGGDQAPVGRDRHLVSLRDTVLFDELLARRQIRDVPLRRLLLARQHADAPHTRADQGHGEQGHEGDRPFAPLLAPARTPWASGVSSGLRSERKGLRAVSARLSLRAVGPRLRARVRAGVRPRVGGGSLRRRLRGAIGNVRSRAGS